MKAIAILFSVVVGVASSAVAAEPPASAYGMRPLVQGLTGERSVIAIAECPGGLVPIYEGPDWCNALAGGCRPQKVWIMDQTRRGPPLEAHAVNGNSIPMPLWCR